MPRNCGRVGYIWRTVWDRQCQRMSQRHPQLGLLEGLGAMQRSLSFILLAMESKEESKVVTRRHQIRVLQTLWPYDSDNEARKTAPSNRIPSGSHERRGHVFLPYEKSEAGWLSALLRAGSNGLLCLSLSDCQVVPLVMGLIFRG